VNPQPAWSLFRQASYGFGEMNVMNATHALWQWHQNADLSPTVIDEHWLVKGAKHDHTTRRTTREPIFANNERGQLAEQVNKNRLRKLNDSIKV
jgi:hypothetical protein